MLFLMQSPPDEQRILWIRVSFSLGAWRLTDSTPTPRYSLLHLSAQTIFFGSTAKQYYLMNSKFTLKWGFKRTNFVSVLVKVDTLSWVERGF